MSLPRYLLPLAVSAAVVAGCGSSGGGGGDRLTASEYTKQATKICTGSEKATNALKQPTKPEEVKPFLQKGIAITQKAVDNFKALKPPKDLQNQHNAVVDAEQGALDKLKEVTNSLSGDASDAAK